LHPVDSFKGMTLPGVGLNALNAAIMLGTDGWGEVAESIAGEALEGGGAEVSALRSRVLSNIEQSKLSRPAVNNFRIHSLTDDALFKLDATSSVDSAAFWSGDGNEVRATEFAMNANKITLEMTSGGQYLKSFDLFNQYPYKQAIRPWEALSQRFAENASGKVYAFTKGAVPDSVFNRIEYPVLINNPSVTDIMFEPEYKNLLKPKI
ncbi:MAG TPA: hypothetical protein VGV92_09345, partial [Gammaproteobacteria bacterium]|nr:hypothetical protein [Gammaproteobacteria bacterium]